MSTPEDNPWDKSIPDPFDPDSPSIEDPFHGPSATMHMQLVPPMPLGNGRYLQRGIFSTEGTAYVDALGRPVHVIGAAPRSMSELEDEQRLYGEWREAFYEGEAALTALEAARQAERLAQRGVVHAFRPGDVCGGGKRLDACETAQTMISETQQLAERPPFAQQPGEGRIWRSWLRVSQTCGVCSLSCQVAIEIKDGLPTGITRFTNAKPLSEAEFPILHLNLAADLAALERPLTED